MKIFYDNIEKQLEFNKGKNLFYRGIINSLRFTPDTLKAIGQIDKIDASSVNTLIDKLTDRTLREFCEVNQYYTFDELSKKALRGIYVELLSDLKNHRRSIDSIEKNHYESLIKWLKKNNPFAEEIYSSKDKVIEPVACSEYSPEIQIEILQIDVEKIIEPVLDIGCGTKAQLVMYLRQNQIEAYGFDRFVNENSFLVNSDWFDYKYNRRKWGTIISNLGFSNHFIHHHLRNDGSFIDYAKQYMVILDSLKTGGSFHYAPDLPFIEQYLDENKYDIIKQNIGNYPLRSMRIKRLK